MLIDGCTLQALLKNRIELNLFVINHSKLSRNDLVGKESSRKSTLVAVLCFDGSKGLIGQQFFTADVYIHAKLNVLSRPV